MVGGLAAGYLLAGCSLANPEIPPTPTPFDLPTLAPTETPALAPTPTGGSQLVGCTTDGSFLNEQLDPQPVAPGQVFTVTWRLGNSGSCAWQGIIVRFVGGNQLGGPATLDVPATAAGGEAKVTLNLIAPSEEGEYTGVWQLALADGTPFGARPYVRVTVDAGLAGAATPDADATGTQQAVGPEGCVLDAVFVQDLTVPDDTEIPPGAAFTKTWRLRNNSLCDWGLGFRFVFDSGSLMGANGTVALPPVKAGNDFDVSVDFVAPQTPGEYTSRWQIVGPDGEPFGNTPFVRIVVPASGGTTPTATPTVTPTAEG
jgi:hypothetical protein